MSSETAPTTPAMRREETERENAAAAFLTARGWRVVELRQVIPPGYWTPDSKPCFVIEDEIL